ncbi:hypothetical protein [Acinetobacter baumannii]
MIISSIFLYNVDETWYDIVWYGPLMVAVLCVLLAIDVALSALLYAIL